MVILLMDLLNNRTEAEMLHPEKAALSRDYESLN